MQKMLNIGCGHRFHSDWENIDIEPASPSVKKVNILKGLPYGDNTFDVLYHSNVLEHLPQSDGKKLIAECFRVLKPGGTLRVNVPDLEKICREYLNNLEKAADGDRAAEHNYNWILIEMLDQVSRNKSGGEMAEYLSKKTIPNPDYLRYRLGNYVDEWRNNISNRKKKSFSEKIKYILKHPDRLKRIWHAIVLSSREREQIAIGRFRTGGEVHYHMYDRFSLTRLMKETGFKETTFMTPVTSNISNWTSYNLDSPDDGAALLAEAKK